MLGTAIKFVRSVALSVLFLPITLLVVGIVLFVGMSLMALVCVSLVICVGPIAILLGFLFGSNDVLEQINTRVSQKLTTKS
jgi:hypothetical protein